MTTTPLTEQQLTAAIYDALVDFQRTARLSSLQHAQMRQHLAEHLAGALALRMGVAPSPAEIRADAFRELADRADPKRPEVSWFGDFGHQVGEWIRKQAEYEQNAAPAPATAPLAASHGPEGAPGRRDGNGGRSGRLGDSEEAGR